MTKQHDNDSILKNMSIFPEGASLEKIRMALQWPLSHTRTLQRRLASLVRENRLLVEGASRSRRYRLPLTKEASFAVVPMSVKDENELKIPLSTIAETIKEKVRQQQHLRLPVGYNREFLYQYRPNHTYYLSDLVRRHLLEIGGSHGDYPAGTYAKQILNRLLIELSWNSSRLEGNTYGCSFKGLCSRAFGCL